MPNSIPKNSNNLHATNEICIYDPLSRSWRTLKTNGTIPARSLFPASCYHDHHLYTFGGQHGYPDEDPDFVEGNNNLLYCLNMVTQQWKLLESDTSNVPLPCEKSLMIGYKHCLYLLGGYGDPPDEYHHNKPKFEVDPSTSYQWPRAWLGSLNRYNTKSKDWTLLKCSLSPRCGHAGDKMDQFWIIFGGCGLDGKLNDVHLYDFELDTWTCLDAGFRPPGLYYLERDIDDAGLVMNSHKKYPEPRSGHCLTYIGNQRFFLYGGIGMMNTPLNDAWILEVKKLDIEWIRYELKYDHGPIRCLHVSCLVQDEVIIHSGCTQEFYTNRLELDDHAESTLHFQFDGTLKSLFKIAFEAVLNLDFHPLVLQELPLNLRNALEHRQNSTEYARSLVKCGERVFSRSMMFSGL